MKPLWLLAITFFALGAAVSSAQWAPTAVAIAYVEGNVYIDEKPLSQAETGVQVLAAVIPASRAMRIDPTLALR
jgi:hypothetical protein